MTTTTTGAAARRRADTSEGESLLHGMASDDENDEEAREEVSNTYKYYQEQNALPWWRRNRDPMVHSVITRPPLAEIVRGICFLCIGTALVTLGCLIYTSLFFFLLLCFFFPILCTTHSSTITGVGDEHLQSTTDHVSFMEPRAGITLIIAGCLLFIPGVYVTMLTVQACLGLNGTTYDDIPGATL